jgi:hypothetical protein
MLVIFGSDRWLTLNLNLSIFLLSLFVVPRVLVILEMRIQQITHTHYLYWNVKSEKVYVIFTVFECRCVLHWYLETEVLQYVVCSCPPGEVPRVRGAEPLSFTLSCLGLMGHCHPLRRLIKFWYRSTSTLKSLYQELCGHVSPPYHIFTCNYTCNLMIYLWAVFLSLTDR